MIGHNAIEQTFSYAIVTGWFLCFTSIVKVHSAPTRQDSSCSNSGPRSSKAPMSTSGPASLSAQHARYLRQQPTPPKKLVLRAKSALELTSTPSCYHMHSTGGVHKTFLDLETRSAFE